MGRLHCLLPWWEDATVDFMASGGYNVSSQIKKVHKEHKYFAFLNNVCCEYTNCINSLLAIKLQHM